MDQAEKADAFARLHVKGDPVILYNAWDAGTARAVAEAGAKAVATGSLWVAAAHGYDDGEAIPLDLVETILRRIAASVDLPVTLDFEGAYAVEPEAAAANVVRMIGAGAIGINFEDRVVGGEGLHPVDRQVRRIAAIRQAADATGVPLFLNARTDLFLQERAAGRDRHAELLVEAREREAAYREAGANGFFAPALVDRDLIAELCQAASLPVNVIMFPGIPERSALAAAGVARISYGPAPYRWSMEWLRDKASAALNPAG